MAGFDQLNGMLRDFIAQANTASLLFCLLGMIIAAGFFGMSSVNPTWRSRGIAGGLAAMVAGAVIPLANVLVGA